MEFKKLVCWLSLLVSFQLYAGDIRIVTFYAPPLVNKQSSPDLGTTYQIIVDAFNRANLTYGIEYSPESRALKSAKLKRNVCTFPVARSQILEADFIWVGPIAISQYALYHNKTEPSPLITIADAMPYQIVSYEGYPVARQLQEQGFKILLTKELDEGLKMLRRSSVDYWLSDTRTADSIADTLKIPVTNQPFVFLTDIKYLACNKEIAPLMVARLQSEISAMITSGEVSISFR
ncbi:hypothetical protein EK599_06990 [Vibrio sp. T187]|uniref:hypothetical protein n=1 Tax=Vibrio TaxID=662 RepID=UPI0010C9D45F|nr:MULTISPECIES: hypothetical protein [Vibrio]MBW3695434.1 hypothetical protein [Vibrio sp. T187]